MLVKMCIKAFHCISVIFNFIENARFPNYNRPDARFIEKSKENFPPINEDMIVGNSMVRMNTIENIPVNNGNNNSSLSFLITLKLNFVISQLLENVSNKVSASTSFRFMNIDNINIYI